MKCPIVTSTGTLALGTILTLACSEPAEPLEVAGALDVYVTVTGLLTDSATHAVVVAVTGLGELPPQTIPYSGGTAHFPDLPVGTNHSVRVESPAATCWVTGRNPRAFGVVGGRTIRIDFFVSCFGPPDVVLGRTILQPVTDDEPYVLSERYVLEEGGTFRLQQFVTAHGGVLWELRGTYSHDGAAYRFTFEDSFDWQASGTQEGQCLAIGYNTLMRDDGFVDGPYCAGGVAATFP
jgi:hypothetical protein